MVGPRSSSGPALAAMAAARAGAVVARRRGHRGRAPRPGRRRAAARPAGPGWRRHPRPARRAWADQVVRDGDRVTGRGQVVALPGRPVQLCAPYATIAIYPEPVPAPCRVAVTVTGLDLDRLTHRKERDGAVWGSARVEGVYRAGTLTVTRQLDDRPGPVPDVVTEDRVPCPEPPRRLAAPAGRPVAADRRARRGGAAPTRRRYNGPCGAVPVRLAPAGHLRPQGDRGLPGRYDRRRRGGPARRSRQSFPAEHLCVTTVRWSKAAMDAAQRQLSGPAAEAAGVSGGLGEVLADRVVAELVVLDERASRFLAGVADGRVTPQAVAAQGRLTTDQDDLSGP